ncbi:MAG: LysR family transcriptional regulator [Planctomycetota bacterium]|jgi:DNA-binding transcriptional LysR family regulator
MIQLNRLEGFYWVARTGGYSKAARAFPYPITQPAVHQQVKKLERELGVGLFERVGKDRILLTPAGRRLFDFVSPFYNGLSGLVRSLRGGEYGGELCIHAGPMILRHLLPGWLERLHRRHPAVQVDLQELTDLDTGALERGEADAVISYLPEIGTGIATRRVATTYPFLVLPANHRLARRARIPLGELREETFVGYSPGTYMHDQQVKELARHDIRPERFIGSFSADTILGFVASGLGYSLVPDLKASGPRLKGLVARRLGGKRNIYPIVVAWRKSAAENPLLDAFLEAAPQESGG